MEEELRYSDANALLHYVDDHDFVLVADYRCERTECRAARHVVATFVKKYIFEGKRVLYFSIANDKEALLVNEFVGIGECDTFLHVVDDVYSLEKLIETVKCRMETLDYIVIDTLCHLYTENGEFASRVEELEHLLQSFLEIEKHYKVILIIEYGWHSEQESISEICRGIGFDIADMVDAVVLVEKHSGEDVFRIHGRNDKKQEW